MLSVHPNPRLGKLWLQTNLPFGPIDGLAGPKLHIWAFG